MGSSAVNIITSYFSQGMWSVLLWLTLTYFYKIYHKKYLLYWSWSWLAFAIYAFFAAISFRFSQFLESGHILRTFFTTFSLAGAYQQIFWLLVGTYVLTSKRKLSKKVTFWTPLAILLFSIFMATAYNFNPDAQEQRIIIRLGLKSFMFAMIYIISALLLLKFKNKVFFAGRLIVILAFILFGISQMIYFLFAIDFFQNNEIWYQVALALFIIDSLSLAMIGLGTIIWILEEERLELEKANKNLDSFLYSTSHDLRAPVASLLGLINVAKHDIKDKVGQNYLKMMGDRVSKLDEIFKDILAYSRTSKGNIIKEAVDFNVILDEIIGEIKFMENAEQISLHYEPDPKYVIKTDRGQLKIILGNLLSNAVKYHDKKKEKQYIKVEFQVWEKDVMVSIEDNGLGIEKESISKIFEMFYRAHNTSSGSGLGLFILKEAAQKVNAEINVQSEIGKGTKFELQFKGAAIAQKLI